jgi:hypothetical protein
MESATSLDTLATAFNGLGHPVRLRALVLLEFEASPSERTELADHVLGTVNGLLNMPARKRGRQGQQRWAALASWAVESQAAA